LRERYSDDGYSFFIGLVVDMVVTRQSDYLVSISELRGAYPDIVLPENMRNEFGVDALFVTLPIGRAGARSRNGRTYTREAVQAMVDAVNANRPEGRWGHLRDDERSTRYDPPAIRWLAAMMDEQGVAWAKGIPLTAEAREHFRVAKIAGAKVGTSVYGFGKLDGERVVAFELETIDLADPNRVGIPDTAAKPMLTTEMEGEDEMEVTLNDVPESVRQQIIEQAANQANGTRIQELDGQVQTLTEQVTTLTTERDAARGEVSRLLVTYAESRIAEQVTLEPVRVLVARLVGIREQNNVKTLEGASTVAEVDSAIATALEDATVKAFNKDALAEMLGPDFKAPGSKQNEQPILGTVPPY
jgi:hypothetical protein